MEKYSQERIWARRKLLARIAEIDTIGDEEIDRAIRTGIDPVCAILELSENERVVRLLNDE